MAIVDAVNGFCGFTFCHCIESTEPFVKYTLRFMLCLLFSFILIAPIQMGGVVRQQLARQTNSTHELTELEREGGEGDGAMSFSTGLA